MKTFTLLLASIALAPAFAVIGRGAKLEHWPTIAAGAAVLIVALGAVAYLLD